MMLLILPGLTGSRGLLMVSWALSFRNMVQ